MPFSLFNVSTSNQSIPSPDNDVHSPSSVESFAIERRGRDERRKPIVDVDRRRRQEEEAPKGPDDATLFVATTKDFGSIEALCLIS